MQEVRTYTGNITGLTNDTSVNGRHITH